MLPRLNSQQTDIPTGIIMFRQSSPCPLARRCCSHMFPWPDIPTSLCSPSPMFPHPCVPLTRCSHLPVFPWLDVPTSLCSPGPMFPHPSVPLANCSLSPVLIPSARCPSVLYSPSQINSLGSMFPQPDFPSAISSMFFLTTAMTKDGCS